MVAFRPLRAMRTAAVAGYRDLRKRPPGRPPGSTKPVAAQARAETPAALQQRIAAAEKELGLRQNPALPSGLVATLRSKFRSFHGVDPKQVRFVRLPDFPRGAWLLGRAKTISYIPPSYSERSEGGKKIEFVHEFTDRGFGARAAEPRPLLLGSADGRQLIIYRAKSRFNITARGIVG
jgi:hypothetical protein